MAGEATAGNGVSGGDLRASILSDLAGGQKDDAPVVEAEAEEAESTVETDDEAAEAETDAQPDDSDDSDEETTDSDDETDEDDAEPADPKVAKGLDQVRRAEKHARERLNADRQAFEAEREQHKAALAEVEQFKALAKRAKYDPAAVLRALGVDDDDFELVGHALYADSKAGQADPARKQTVQARLAQRERDEKLSAYEKKLADLEAKYEADKRAMVEQTEVQQYVGAVNENIKRTPLVAHLHKADPEAVNDGLLAAHARLVKAGNTAPTPKQVVLAYEKRERARLSALGVDLTKYAAPTKVAAKPGVKPVVATKAPANTNGATKKAPTRDDIVAELASLKDDHKLTS